MVLRIRSSAAALLVFSQALPAASHPRDELGQASYIGITPATITVELNLTPGDELAAGFAALAQKPDFSQRVLRELSLTIDGKPLTLKLVRGPLKTAELSTKLFLEAPLASLSGGAHTLRYENHYAPFKSGYLATTLAGTDGITVGSQTHNALQSALMVDFQAPSARPPGTVWIVGGLLLPCVFYALARSRGYPK